MKNRYTLAAMTVGTVALILSAGSARANLLISEYVEGSSYNKAIEIYNHSNTAYTFGASDVLNIYFNGNTSAFSVSLTGTVNANDVFVIVDKNSAGSDLSGQPYVDETSGSLSFNGNDAVALSIGGSNMDMMGTIGDASNFAYHTTLRRNASVTAGTSTYDPNQWTSFAVDTFNGLGVRVGTVPEPTSASLMLMGLSGLLLAGQRRPRRTRRPRHPQYLA